MYAFAILGVILCRLFAPSESFGCAFKKSSIYMLLSVQIGATVQRNEGYRRGLSDADYMHLGCKSLQINRPSSSLCASIGWMILKALWKKDRFAVHRSESSYTSLNL